VELAKRFHSAGRRADDDKCLVMRKGHRSLNHSLLAGCQAGSIQNSGPRAGQLQRHASHASTANVGASLPSGCFGIKGRFRPQSKLVSLERRN
jgi:hypothetical protein